MRYVECECYGKVRRERDLNPRDLHRSQAFDTWKVPGLRPTRLGDPGSKSTQFFLYINY